MFVAAERGDGCELTLLRPVATQEDLVSVATISCHGNEALCERLGVDHGTYYFKDGVIDVKSGEVRVARHCAHAVASSAVSLSLSLFVVLLIIIIICSFVLSSFFLWLAENEQE